MKKDVVFGDVSHELAATRRLLERLPETGWTWSPHEKSTKLGELATHVTNLVSWQLAILHQPEFDLASVPPPREAVPDREALLEEYDARARELEDALDAVDEEALEAEWTLRRGEHVMSRRPRAVALRTFGLSHMIHHRGQLGVYLRLLDVPLPSIYGPTADER